jgi:hypothetical protein
MVVEVFEIFVFATQEVQFHFVKTIFCVEVSIQVHQELSE